MHAHFFMRFVCLLALLLALPACSPTTDITRTSTEPTAGRTPYEVIQVSPAGDLLHVKMRVWSPGAAQTVAEDVVMKKRTGYDRVDVEIYGWTDQWRGSPFAALRWSTTRGFSFAKTR